MNDYSHPSKFLVLVKTCDDIPTYANYYQLSSICDMIKDLINDTDTLIKSENGYYILESPFSSKVWSLMLTIIDQGLNLDNTKLFPPKDVKFRELVDFIDFYQLQPPEYYYDIIFEHFISNKWQYSQLRDLADKLDSGEIKFQLYQVKSKEINPV